MTALARRLPPWTPAWFARQLRPWRIGLSRGDVRHRPLLSALGAAIVWSFWFAWAAIVALVLVYWWIVVAVIWAWYLLVRAGIEAGFWTAGKVADRA